MRPPASDIEATCFLAYNFTGPRALRTFRAAKPIL
jgi:hypothetical protein